MADMHSEFQVTSFVDGSNLATFADGTLETRNPRRGQWVKTGWSDKRARFIGVSRDGTITMDFTAEETLRSSPRRSEHGRRLTTPKRLLTSRG